MNYNFISKLEYHGKNQVGLELSRLRNGYKSDGWVTFYEATRLMGKKVKAGSHGEYVFKGFATFDDKDSKGKFITVKRPLGSHKVFNLDQLEEIKEAK